MSTSFPYLIKSPGWTPWQYLNTAEYGNNTIDIVPFAKIPESILPASKIWGQGVSENCYLTISGLKAIYALGSIKGIYPYPPPTLGYCIGNLYKENIYFYMYLAYSDPPLFDCVSDVFQRSNLKRIYIQHGKILSFTTNKKSGLLIIDYQGTVPSSILSKGVTGNVTITRKIDGKSYSLNITGINSTWGIITSLPPSGITFNEGDFYQLDKIWCVEDPLMMSGQWWGNEDEKVTNLTNSGNSAHITEHNKPYNELSFTGSYIWKNNVNGKYTTAIISEQTELDSITGGEWFWIPFKNPQNPSDASTIYTTDNRFKYAYQSNVSASAANVKVSTSTSNVYASITGTVEFIAETGNVASVVQPIEIKFKTGTTSDITDWNNLWANNSDNTQIPYIRMELNKGGNADYQNWHSPNLTSCWLIQNDSYFEILGQPDGNVIDVALRDVSNTKSIDTTAFAHSKIFNQYAWMLNSHYATDDYKGIFQGTITNSQYNQGNNTTVITINVEEVSHSTLLNTGFNGTFAPTFIYPTFATNSNNTSYNPKYLNEVNSFYNRFRLNPTDQIINSSKMIPLYDKMFNWKLVGVNTTAIFNITNLTFSAFPTTFNTTYQATITVTGSSNLLVGNEVYVTFDTPYSISLANSASNATTSVTTANIAGDFYATADLLNSSESATSSGVSLGGVTLEGVTAGLAATSITLQSQTAVPNIWNVCLDFNWRSKIILQYIPRGTIVGVCGGKFWGMSNDGKTFAFSENGANLAFATYVGALCTSALYNNFTVEDMIAYTDPHYNTVIIRRSELEGIESPRRCEVDIGQSSFTETISSSPYSLNSSQDRLKKITFAIETTLNSGENIMVAVKNVQNIYGNIIGGKGEVDLQTLRKQGVANGVVNVSTYNFNGYDASPVYIYKASTDACLYTKNSIDVGISTTDSPIYLLGSSNSSASKISTAQYSTSLYAEYVKNNQVLRYNTLFDVFRTEDGEEVIVYGHPVNSFTVNNQTVNAGLWETSNAVFITGKGNDSNEWGCPLIKALQYPIKIGGIQSTDFQYPMMVLPCVDYLGSVYHWKFYTLFIFVRYYTDATTSHIGCYTIPYLSLLDLAYKATNSGYLDFLYRPLAIPQSVLTAKSNYSPISIQSQANLPQSTGTMVDSFSPVILTEMGTNVIFPFITKDGTLAALYDSVNGIQLVYTRDGYIFKQSPIIIARGATSPLLIDKEIVVFIINGQIGIKLCMDVSLYDSMMAGDLDPTEGNYQNILESIQSDIDDNPTIMIGSGNVVDQKLTGYRTSTGVFKIFFYTGDNTLTCMQSTDMYTWKFAPNF